MAFIYAASAVGSYPGIGNNCDYCDRRFEGSPEDVYAVARVFGREFAEDFLTPRLGQTCSRRENRFMKNTQDMRTAQDAAGGQN